MLSAGRRAGPDVHERQQGVSWAHTDIHSQHGLRGYVRRIISISSHSAYSRPVCRIKAALILGVKSGFPCPICLVPRDKLYLKSIVWPLRTVSGTSQLREQARSA